MKISSLSICVPTNSKCVNNCIFCVSKTHTNPYPDMFRDAKNIDKIYYRNDIKKRLQFAKIHNVDTIVLTGTGEPLQNMGFLDMLNTILIELDHPFPRIELQTSGVMLSDDNLRFLREINVNTISLSISNLFNNERNLEIIGVPEKLNFSIEELCESLYKFNFNIRLSLNLTKDYSNICPKEYFLKAKSLHATHITFRKLYASENNTPEDQWVKENKLSDIQINKINSYIKDFGNPLYVLPFGFTAYSCNEISTVLDDNCMDVSKDADDTLKYLILRENAKLYTKWDDFGSIIF